MAPELLKSKNVFGCNPAISSHLKKRQTKKKVLAENGS
jgi:hypothetical protein